MQNILGCVRRAIQQYHLIEDSDRIAVGVSGGKDSIALLMGLIRLKKFIGIDYSLVAITLDPGFGGVQTDYSPISKLCEENGVKYIIKRTNISEIIFDIRKETNPCSLCARMRRGALHDAAKESGCNKIALGHNYEDVVETFVMNLFYEGRIGCFSPKTYLSRKDLTMIRPLIFATEAQIRSAVKKAGLPIVKSKCPVDGYTTREKTKDWLKEMEKERHGFKDLLFGAMQRAGIDGW